MRQSLADMRQRRMIGCAFSEWDAKKLTKRKAVGTPPGDATLRLNPLKVADEQHSEVDSRGNAGATFVLVVGLTDRFDPSVKARLGQQVVELSVEDMSI